MPTRWMTFSFSGQKKYLLGPTNPALQIPGQQSDFWSRRKPREIAQFLWVLLPSWGWQLILKINSVPALAADIPQGRPWLLSLLLNSKKCVPAWGGQGQLCAGPGVVHRALAVGLLGGKFSLRAERGWGARSDSTWEWAESAHIGNLGLSNSLGVGSFGFVAKLSFFGCFLDCGPGPSETSPKVDKADPWAMAQQGPKALWCG